MNTDVLVVGAGPSGLMLALQLARRGVRPLIIDRHSGPAQQTRAIGVQARTLEIYAHLGIVADALRLGKKSVAGNMWAMGRRVARIPFGESGTGFSPYPFILLLGQDDNEALLGEALRGLGGAVQWNTELLKLTQHVDHVTAKLRDSDGTEREVTAAWVAGCDGARSTVREQCGIEFVGAPYEHVFYVADTETTGPMVPDELNAYLWRGGFHLFFPMRGPNRWRIIGIVPRALRGRDDLTLDPLLPAIRAEAGAALEVRACNWFSTYRIHHRRAAQFRAGRCFLVGDAAHIHSPMGAQGMNTGLQDAYNLAWKLTLVISGAAGEGLLDSYAGERMPVAARLLRSTDRAFMLAVSDSYLAGLVRTRVVARVAAFLMWLERMRRFVFRAISQTGIRYRHSPLSETQPGLPDEAPHAGDRFPWLQLRFADAQQPVDLFDALDDARFTLLVIGQDAPPDTNHGWGELVRVHMVPNDANNARELTRAGIASPSFYLLRPDGYIGCAGTRADPETVQSYLTNRLTLRSAQPALSTT